MQYCPPNNRMIYVTYENNQSIVKKESLEDKDINPPFSNVLIK